MKPNISSVSLQELPLEFDHQATTPCAQEVLDAMEPYWNEVWGNASNRQNRSGIKASAAVSVAREKISSLLGLHPEGLIFTSGATEANNLALLGYARSRAAKLGAPGHLITLTTEHHAVLDPLRQLAREGFRLTELEPGIDGVLSIDQFADAFQKDTFLVSVMMANNEIGVVQPLVDFARICHERGVIIHSDIAQAFGNIPIQPELLDLDLMSISGHKLYGPKGIGALAIRSDVSLAPLFWGGMQENGLRPGTLPVPLIVGLAKAAELAVQDIHERNIRLTTLRNQLWHGLKKQLPDLIINGSIDKRLSHNLNFTIPGVSGYRLHRELKPLVSCSSGSACSNGAPSHVLIALGRSKKEAEASLRLGIGRNTNIDEINQAILFIVQVVNRLRGL